MYKSKLFFLISFALIFNVCIAQDVPITDYRVNVFGQVQLEIEGQSDKYYLLSAEHAPEGDYESITSMTLGIDGIMTISEPMSAYPLENYKITAYSVTDPADVDGDGIDDITEFNNLPSRSPLNAGREIPLNDGTAAIESREVFSELAVVSDDIPWAPFLNNQEFVKFAIVNQGSTKPEIYFINSNTHYIHADFLATINVNRYSDDVTAGEIIYNPNASSPNGSSGVYTFNYSFGEAYTFDETRQTFELLAKNMPFLRNNFQHFIGSGGEAEYNGQHKEDYQGSRIGVVLESEYFADVDFLPFNQAEGYGFFRKMDLDDNPGSRDVVLYDALPNSLPRVGGIITSVVQTPLSHVNLRAIQDNVPNAYIKEPLEIPAIADLIGKYVYYKVTEDDYEIREASLEDVNDWYEKLRPTEDQIPNRDLSQTDILPLDDIGFEMSTSFGAKCTNLATMRTFGFPEGTIPNGFGVPFYFYDEFMKYNGFYNDVEEMISDPEFINDLETRIDMLKDFRKEIKAADMPQWMLDELQAMHESFPEGTSVRCRSSTNNEDLPGFSGAGLYTSKTQHPEEGHISKSIKQVYASMWNFRAFDERDFYRIDHYIAAMGVLCHPNFEEEKSNGVGVSLDPIYQTDNTFYLNTQVGEFLITNPDANSIPEEILLSEDPAGGYIVLRRSNLVPNGQLVMDHSYLDQMRTYLKVIHDEFAILYDVVGVDGFGMDIEYKVTAEDQLIIKQARPWVSFWAEIKSNFDLSITEILEPISSASLGDAELVKTTVSNTGLKQMSNFELLLFKNEQLVETLSISDTLERLSDKEYQFEIPQDFSSIGDYDLSVVVSHIEDGYNKNDTLKTVISKLHALEAGIETGQVDVKCRGEVELTATILNYGGTTITNTEVEVILNGQSVETVEFDVDIPYLSSEDIRISLNENLQDENNITLNLLKINNEEDAVSTNNTTSVVTNLDSEFDYVTLIIFTDNYPLETSWAIFNEDDGELVESGNIDESTPEYRKDICLSNNSCYSLFVYDFAGDGICCRYGEGNFLLVDVMGDTLLTNDGNFNLEVEEMFCTSPVISSTNDFTYQPIKVYPNPTQDILTIDISDVNIVTSDIKVEIYNSIGSLVAKEAIPIGMTKKTITMSHLRSGSYIAKCYNRDFEAYYKIIKL